MMNLTLSTDGRRLAGAEAFYGPVRVWDIDWSNADDPVFALRDQQVPGAFVALSPNGSLMAAGGDGSPAGKLWDVSQTPFQLVREIDGGRLFAFSPDGNQLAAAVGLGFQIYAREKEGWVRRYSLTDGMGPVLSLTWSPDQKTMLAGEQYGAIHVWDMSVDPPQRRNPSRPASHVMRAAISPDGRSMLASGADLMTTAWNLEGAAPARLKWEATGGAMLSSFSHDSRLAHWYGPLWNLKTNPPVSVSDPIPEVSRFSPVEPCLISISFSDNRLFRRDWKLTQRGRFVHSNERDLWTSPATSTPFNMFDALNSLQFGSQRFATRHGDPTVGNQTVNVWDLANATKPLHEIKHNLIFGHQNNSLTLSPDGNLLLAFAQNERIVWDLKETPPREYRVALSAYFQDAFFTADNKRLFVADESGSGIYDWVNNREVRRLKYPGLVRQIIPHPDGQHLITVNGNGTAYILRLPELAEHSRPNP